MIIHTRAASHFSTHKTALSDKGTQVKRAIVLLLKGLLANTLKKIF